jgi:DNA-binding response OmpR family regulator
VERRRVLVLEDEPRIAEMLESYLRRDGFETTLCGTVSEAIESVRASKPDMMILDVMLPDGSGLDVLREASYGGRRVPAIVLSARADEADRIVGLELGADDYVTKPFSPREVIARVRALLRRIDELNPPPRSPANAVRVGALEVDAASHEVRVDGRLASLTATEFRILSILAAAPGEVFTRAQLLGRMPDSANIYERTLDRHINNLRRKIEPDSSHPSYVVTVYGIGYKLHRP